MSLVAISPTSLLFNFTALFIDWCIQGLQSMGEQGYIPNPLGGKSVMKNWCQSASPDTRSKYNVTALPLSQNTGHFMVHLIQKMCNDYGPAIETCLSVTSQEWRESRNFSWSLQALSCKKNMRGLYHTWFSGHYTLVTQGNSATPGCMTAKCG